MLLLPSEQTERQLKVFEEFVKCDGAIILREPCDCGGQIRHNNGGNYHRIVAFRMDAGKVWRRQTTTSDYDTWSEWEEITFTKVIEEMASLAASGYRLS